MGGHQRGHRTDKVVQVQNSQEPSEAGQQRGSPGSLQGASADHTELGLPRAQLPTDLPGLCFTASLPQSSKSSWECPTSHA